jgi:predicted RNA-binding protein with PUA domain
MELRECPCGGDSQGKDCPLCGIGAVRYWCEVCGKVVTEKRCSLCGLKTRKMRREEETPRRR